MNLLNVGVNVMVGRWDDKWSKREESFAFIPRKMLYLSLILAGGMGFCTAFVVMGIINIIKSL